MLGRHRRSIAAWRGIHDVMMADGDLVVVESAPLLRDCDSNICRTACEQYKGEPLPPIAHAVSSGPHTLLIGVMSDGGHI
jgi:hypothetical protein